MNERSNEQWLEALHGPERDRALAELRVVLVRGLKATLRTRLKSGLDEAAEDFAQEALVKVMSNLDSFRGESRFTTWAQKITVRVALTELRRRRFQDVSFEEIAERREEGGRRPEALADSQPLPDEEAARREVLAFVQHLLDRELTERQRKALVVVVFEGISPEVAAREMGTSRGALYKLLHDARKKLRRRLEAEGLSPQEILEQFEWK